MKTNVWIALTAAACLCSCANSDVDPTDSDYTPVAAQPPSGDGPSSDDNGVDPMTDFDNDDVVVTPDPDTETCPTTERSCYSGPEGTAGVGVCSAGVQRCQAGEWGACEGAVEPGAENALDGVDNDCNGDVDENFIGASSLAGGHWHSCFLHDTGTVYCWGHNEYGQIGNGTNTHAESPLAVYASDIFEQITAGYMFNCALSGGDAYCWGRNEHGVLGDGTTDNRSIPVQVQTPFQFTSLTAGNHHVCGLTTDGKVACWGSTKNAQIVDPSLAETILYPQPLELGVKLVSITAGQLHTCGLDIAGRAYCWGYNGHGQISDSGEAFETTPVQVGDTLRFTRLSAGYRFTCGVAQGGDVWCWGRGSSGQLGNGANDDHTQPVRVALDEPVEQVFSGFFHACALTMGGETYCWGQGHEGQLGNGASDHQSLPVLVDAPEQMVDMAMMVTSTCGRTISNQMYCWGSNDYGQFAASSPSGASTPTASALP